MPVSRDSGNPATQRDQGMFGTLGSVPTAPREKVAVVCASSVGLCSAVMLARQHDVVIQDDRSTAVQMIADGDAPSDDPDVQAQLLHVARTLRSTQSLRDALTGAALVVITTPTSYTRWRRTVDTTNLDRVLREVTQTSPEAMVVIESTLPVDYTRTMAQRLQLPQLLAAPVHVRPERALIDRQNQAALIVGGPLEVGAACAGRWLSA